MGCSKFRDVLSLQTIPDWGDLKHNTIEAAGREAKAIDGAAPTLFLYQKQVSRFSAFHPPPEGGAPYDHRGLSALGLTDGGEEKVVT